MYTGITNNLEENGFMNNKKISKSKDKQDSTEKDKAKKREGLAINNVDPAVRKGFVDLAKSKGVTQNSLFADIFNSYRNLHLEFNKAESALMQEAHGLISNAFHKRIKKMVLRYA